MNTPIRISVFVMMTLGLLVAGRLTASDPVTQKLLTEFWSTTQGQESNRYYAAQQDRSPASLYAFALLKAYQHDVDMSLKAIEVLRKADPGRVKPLRLKVWLQLRQDRFDVALGSLVEYIRLIDATPGISEFDRQESMAFAGRVFGFLDGPVAAKVKPADRETAIDQIMSLITDRDEESFEKGYARVVGQYEALMNEKKRVDAEAAAEDAVVQQVKYRALEARERELHEAEQRTAAERRQTRAQINQGLTDIARNDLFLANQQAVIAPRLVHTHPTYKIHTSEGTQYIKHPHSVAGHAVHRPVFVRNGYHDLHARRQILAGHYAQLRDLGAGQMDSLNRELKEISKAKSRTLGQKLRALRPSGKIVTESVALRTRARSIMTYEQFPLEIEKALLLSTK